MSDLGWGQALDKGGANFDMPEDIFSEIIQMGAATSHPKPGCMDWIPGMITRVNGHPIMVVKQITREEFVSRVFAAGVGTDWLNCPPGTMFWQITTD